MSKYTIYFGTVNENNEFVDIEKIPYLDSKDNKQIINVKDFLTNYDDNLCTCMLKYYKINQGYMSSSYDNYNNNNEDSLKLKEIHNKMCIAIMKIKKYCDYNFLVDNEGLRANSKKEMIKLFLEQKEKINELQKEINFLVKKDEMG